MWFMNNLSPHLGSIRNIVQQATGFNLPLNLYIWLKIMEPEPESGDKMNYFQLFKLNKGSSNKHIEYIKLNSFPFMDSQCY